MVSLAPRVALERTVHKNVSAIMEGRVRLPQANVTAVQDTQGNGKGESRLYLTACNGMERKLEEPREHLCYHMSVTLL